MRTWRPQPEWIVYMAVALVLWFVPLFDRLHVESSAVIATVAFFTAGLRRLARARLPQAGMPQPGLSQVGLQGQVAAPFIAFGLLSLSALWAPNCDWLRGAGFFVLFVPVSVVFAFSVADCAEAWSRRPQFWFVVTGLVVVIAGPLYDIGWHPQFYTYNHIFGGVLGPIYDEELVVRPGLFVFRGVTLLWAGVLWSAARRKWTLTIPGLVVLAAAYTFSGPLGFNTPAAWLESTYSGHVRTAHFDIHYDADAIDDSLLVRLMDDHEWHYERLRRLTGVKPTERVSSYLNGSPDARARRTGARYTSVAPVWLSRPQMHLSLSSVQSVLSHEMAHVFSRAFGMPVVKASPLVGLVEGFAVAVEAPDGSVPPTDQVAAAWSGHLDEAADRMRMSLSPNGFWGGRGAVSYTTTGAFVGYLLDRYGMEPFRLAYATGRLEDAYGQPLDSLTAGWAVDLGGLQMLSADAGARARARFSVPSLFERVCPHYVPPRVRRYRKAIEEDDRPAMERLVADEPDFFAAWQALAVFHLADEPATARHSLDQVPEEARSNSWALQMAHVHALTGQPDSASVVYTDQLRRTPVSARIMRLRLASWTEAVSTGDLPDVALFSEPHASARTRLEELGDAGRTCDSGASVLSQGMCAELDRMRGYWAMRSAYDAGDLATADSVGQVVRARSSAVGDKDLVRLIDDWLMRIAWSATSPTIRLP